MSFPQIFLAAAFLCLGASARADDSTLLEPAFYSAQGSEREVRFHAEYRSELGTLSMIKDMGEMERSLYAHDRIEPVIKFLFGPLTNRSLASPQKGLRLRVDWNAARLDGGTVILPYDYEGVWIVDKTVPATFQLPVPLSREGLFTPKWKLCTDSDPQHQTEWFYWYFWDPERSGCDHKLGVQYQMVEASLGLETRVSAESKPEYDRLLKSGGQSNRFQLTFGFGYVEDPADPNPEKDTDAGMYEYRDFLAAARRELGPGFRETKIFQKEYRGGSRPERVIGRRFEGEKNGVSVVVNVVTAAGVDQMQLFAKSFAHDHDGFFGWFGHSRVGSGFDAESFWNMVVRDPNYYSVVADYQLVYWGGCNSYSYYTLPFFEFKSHVSGGHTGADPGGTKGLDIIANGLPSYFSLNADNATIVLRHLLNWPAKPGYRQIVDEIEARAARMGIHVLVAVLGDEDNP